MSTDEQTLIDTERPGGILGVSTLLPPDAVEVLLKGYALAVRYPEESLERRRVIDAAIDRVKREHRSLFRNIDDPLPPWLHPLSVAAKTAHKANGQRKTKAS